jgi:F-type H+-transporting ATPase subunit delta
LGGAVVRIGSTVYDGSIRAQLLQLKQKLVNA